MELSGDFTGWEPAAMRRADDDRWRLDIPVPTGVHRVLVRVDGAAWQPPPGLPVADDEYQGQVGVITAE